MPVRDKYSHREAFDHLAEQLRQSIFLAAALLQEHQGAPTAAPPPKTRVTKQLFDAALERYTDIYRRSSYQSIPFGHLLSSAIHTEAMLAYECGQQAARLQKRDSEHLTLGPLLAQARRHDERIGGLINTVRRAKNLEISAHYPYVMPYRGVFLRPFSEALQFRLVRDRDYFRRWLDGVVAVIQDNQIEEFASLAERAAVLYLDADELMDQNQRAQQDGQGMAPALEAVFAQRLHYADNLSQQGLGEEFAHHLNRLLLKQNVILRSLHPRLGAEHPAAFSYFQPLVEENTQQLQQGFMAYPSWAPENFNKHSDTKQLLQALEEQIRAHAASWVEHGETEDSASLMFQFEGVLQARGIAERLTEF